MNPISIAVIGAVAIAGLYLGLTIKGVVPFVLSVSAGVVGGIFLPEDEALNTIPLMLCAFIAASICGYIVRRARGARRNSQGRARPKRLRH